jgi:beta-exotoxin I transport system permease protein
MALTLANVFTKTTRDRWKSMVIGALSLALLLIFGMSVYRGVDVSFWDDLPSAFRTMFGIPDGADVGGLAYGAIYSGYGMLTIAGITLAAGAVSIAGEEKGGTMGLLLGNPVSRAGIVVSKAAALVVVTALGTAILWLGAVVAPVMLDVEIGSMHITALMFMMFVNALFYGFLAMALSAWTGRTGVAIGATSGVLVVGFVATGLLPMFDSLADLARVFPWYYFSASEPMLNGSPSSPQDPPSSRQFRSTASPVVTSVTSRSAPVWSTGSGSILRPIASPRCLRGPPVSRGSG